MSRYIDIDKVLSQLYLDHKDVIYIDKEACAKRIKALQTIDIVRCKECRFWQNKHLCGTWSAFGTIETDADDYCSYGEREGE